MSPFATAAIHYPNYSVVADELKVFIRTKLKEVMYVIADKQYAEGQVLTVNQVFNSFAPYMDHMQALVNERSKIATLLPSMNSILVNLLVEKSEDMNNFKYEPQPLDLDLIHDRNLNVLIRNIRTVHFDALEGIVEILRIIRDNPL